MSFKKRYLTEDFDFSHILERIGDNFEHAQRSARGFTQNLNDFWTEHGLKKPDLSNFHGKTTLTVGDKLYVNPKVVSDTHVLQSPIMMSKEISSGKNPLTAMWSVEDKITSLNKDPKKYKELGDILSAMTGKKIEVPMPNKTDLSGIQAHSAFDLNSNAQKFNERIQDSTDSSVTNLFKGLLQKQQELSPADKFKLYDPNLSGLRNLKGKYRFI